MCGISGLWNIDGAPVSRRTITEMNELLAHRGPDGAGVYVAGNVGLGHTRLAILDPTPAGEQPMAYADGRYRITFNGEIYNFLELRAELIGLGHVFHTETDTEVILAAYAQWGEGCQIRLNGMWGFAIWDAREQTLFLSRDRFGVKPLYYRLTEKSIAFGSELKTFLAVLPSNDLFDKDLIALDLTGRLMPEVVEPTLMNGVRRLFPGHSLTIRAGRPVRIMRWWDTLSHLEPAPTSRAAAEAELRELFLDAVAIRMRSDVPIATALSGGLDSTSVHGAVALLGRSGVLGARTAPNSRYAVHASFPNTRQDELSYAQDAIAKEKTEGVIVAVSPEDVAKYSDATIFSAEDFADNAAGLWLTYRETSRLGIKVSLDGHGADELYAGYHHYLYNAIPDLKDHRLKTQYQDILAGMTLVGDEMLVTPENLDKADFLHFVPELPSMSRMADDIKRTGEMDLVTRDLYLDFHYRTVPPILNKFDRVSMAHGVEIRAPFMDWRLAVKAFTIPSTMKLENGYAKAIMRTALGDLMPESVRWRKSKVGFETPIAEWTNTPLLGYMRDVMAGRSFNQSDIWHGPIFSMIVEKFLAFGTQASNIVYWLWPFVQANRLMDMFQARANALHQSRLSEPT